MSSLAALFSQIPPLSPGVPGEWAFQARPIPGSEAYRLGRDATGRPALLLPCRGSGPAPFQARLRHLSVHPGVTCRIEGNHGSEAARMTILACHSESDTLQGYFLQVVEGLVRALGPRPSPEALRDQVNGLAELFLALEGPPRRQAQGVWGELLAIREATSPVDFARAWHDASDESFDFSRGPQRAEVKTFACGQRTHRFSLRQLRPGPGIEGIILSIRASPMTGGLSLGDLAAQVKALLGTDSNLACRVDRILAQSLGASLEEALGLGFDEQAAASSLLAFALVEVPCIDPSAVPHGVSGITMEVSLEACAPLSAGLQAAVGGLLAQAPRSVAREAP